MDVSFDITGKLDELEEKYKRSEREKIKLERELRTLSKRYETIKMSINTQTSVNKAVALGKEMAEQASRTKSNFLARMSHEIRTPLSAIMGMAELSLREDISEAAAEFISTIIQAGDNLLDIINDILDLSKIETGQLEILSRDYMVTSLINDVLNIIRPRILESKLRFIVDVDKMTPEVLKGDIVRIRQIMLNLLSNAAKYTDKGYVRLSVHSEKIDENNINLIIKVQDTGRGIKNEDIELLFDEYTRFDKNVNSSSEGTGLGLAITKSLLNAMTGDITVESVIGEGSTFTATIPQEVTDHREVAHVLEPEIHNVLIYERREEIKASISQTLESLGVSSKFVSTSDEFYNELISEKYSFVFLAATLFEKIKSEYGFIETSAVVIIVAEYGDVIPSKNTRVLTTPIFSIPCANIFNNVSDNYTKIMKEKSFTEFTAPDAKILIVDDINTNLIIAKGLIQPYDVQIDSCSGGAEAIKAVSSNVYDLILMDYMMPEMDGALAVKRIREMGDINSYFSDVPIVALTANTVLGTKEMLMASGFDDFLSKPIDTVKLHMILEKWIPLSKQEAVKEEQTGNSGLTDIPESIKGLDTVKGVQLSGGSVENYYEVLASFSSDIFERLGKIKNCVQINDLDRYAVYVHAIKSASANIGADIISQFAADLESAANNKNREFIVKNTDYFISALKKILNEINIVLKNYDEKKIKKPESNIKKELSTLSAALNDINITAVNESIETILKLAHTDEKKIIRDISHHILMFEYDKAHELINALLLNY